ncbi:MAG: hypothetical protein J5845_05355 [Lachnospiraceae bacterium]|nr:hypothetical protein [Lachnospiraceae bacterium]
MKKKINNRKKTYLLVGIVGAAFLAWIVLMIIIFGGGSKQPAAKKKPEEKTPEAAAGEDNGWLVSEAYTKTGDKDFELLYRADYDRWGRCVGIIFGGDPLNDYDIDYIMEEGVPITRVKYPVEVPEYETPSSGEEIEYYPSGIVKQRVYSVYGQNWVRDHYEYSVRYSETYSYDEKGNLRSFKSLTLGEPDKTKLCRYKCDEYHHIILGESLENGIWEVRVQSDCDDKGRVICQSTVSEEGQFAVMFRVEYADDGSRTETEYAGTAGFAKVNTYDGKGRPIESRSYDLEGTTVIKTERWEYEETDKGRKETRTVEYRNGDREVYEEEYDSAGRKISVKTVDADERIAYSGLLFDDKGRVTGKEIRNSVGTRGAAYEYDENGNMVLETTRRKQTKYVYTLPDVPEDNEYSDFYVPEEVLKLIKPGQYPD